MGYFWQVLSQRGAQIALIDEQSTHYSYAQLAVLIDDFIEQHFSSSTRPLVLLCCRNQIQSIVCYLACLKSNNPVLLLDDTLAAQLREALVERFQPNLVCQYNDENQFTVKPASTTVHPMAEDLALLLSTSGSTGQPKLVKLSKQNIQSNSESISAYLQLTASDKAISLLPFHYSYGLSVLNSHLFCGGSVVVTGESVMTRGFWTLFKNHEVTSLSGVSYVFEILQKLRFNRMTLPSLRYVTHAGSKISEQLAHQFAKWCDEKNVLLYLMYGQTEATARIAYLDPQKALTKPQSIGKAINNGSLWLVDETGQTLLSPEVTGELAYQGPNVMMGYAHSTDELKDNLPLSTVLKTGDIAHFDSDGDFFITGRLSRFIKLFGLRFNLDQLEQHLQQRGIRSICGGDDSTLKVACLDKSQNIDQLRSYISDVFGININAIEVFLLMKVPLTSSGKTDHLSIFEQTQA